MNGRTAWIETLEGELRDTLSLVTHDLRYYTEVPLAERFTRLRAFIESCDARAEAKPRKTPELCLKAWNDFLRGREGPPDVYVIRQLCWEPSVAGSTRFLKYLMATRPDMTPRSIRGLVYSIHMKWDSGRPDIEILTYIEQLVTSYKGDNKWMAIWKSVVDEIVGPGGPDCFASDIINARGKVHEAFKERSLFVGTEYYDKTLKTAVDIALDRSSFHSSVSAKAKEIQYLMTELLPLPDMVPKTFKKGISRLILSDVLVRDTELVDRVKDGVLRSGKLGDPRVSMNGLNWAGISEDAKSKVIEWLSRADIVFFFENVMTQGSERQGRKDFWLRYVKNFVRTRCLLGREDNGRLVPLFRTTQKEIEGYGRIGGQVNNSAFLLDFGTVLAVEFSRVGACYLYERTKYPKRVEDFWTDEPFSEPDLKNQRSCAARVIHKGRWKYELSGELARLGIRPM